MNPLRLVMVTPRYWPLVGETERFVSSVACELRSQNTEVTILTARWAKDWPGEVIHREMATVRLPCAPRGGWNTFRYMRSVARWLRDHHQQVDVVYVMNLRHDAYAALGAVRDTPLAVVLRTSVGDCRWFETARLGGRLKRRSLEAEAIVAPTRSLAAEARAAGYAGPRIHYIANGVEISEPRSAAARYQARMVLAEANHDLQAAEYAPVAVSVGCFHESQHPFEIVDAWRPIAGRWPSAKLWLLGDGPLRHALYDRIVDGGLHHQVLMPGVFDELDDVFRAADVFVTAAPDSDGGQFLLEAMAAGLPVVATDTRDQQEFVVHGVHGLLVPPGNGAALTEAMGTLFDAPNLAKQYGEAARRQVVDGFSPARMARDHLRLFHRVVASKQRGSP